MSQPILPSSELRTLPPLPWSAGIRKYLKILRISLVERLVYRADFFVATLFRFLPLLTSFLLWEAVYQGANRSEIAGFSHESMIAYLLLVQITRMFSSMPGLATGIARDIRDGNLKKYLLQPIDLLWYLLAYRGAHKLAYIATTSLPYALLFFLCRNVFTGWPDAATLGLYAVSLILSFVVGFFFEACIGMIGFWLLEVTSFLYIIGTVNFFVSGHMFPLDLMRQQFPLLLDFLDFLPFRYLAYFPAMVFLQKVQGPDLWFGLGMELFWAIVFLLLSRWLYQIGLRRYSAYGG